MSNNDDSKSKVPKLEGTPHKIVCMGCGIQCDDVYVELDSQGNLIRVVNACFRGNNFLNQFKTESRYTESLQKSMGLVMQADMKDSISFLSDSVNAAKSISFYGMGVLGYNQQKSVLNFIDKLISMGKKINIQDCSNLLQMVTKYGIPLATIGQGVNNADVFIFMDTDPTHSHPKLTGKLVFTRGLFRNTGKEVKKLILIEKEETEVKNISDLILQLTNENIDDIISKIEKLLKNDDIGDLDICGLNDLSLKNLKTYLTETEYGILVTTIPLDKDSSNKWLQSVSKFLNLLNNHTKGRFTFIPLTVTPNDMGLSNAVLSMFNTEEIEKIIEKPVEPDDLAIVFGGEYLRDEYSTIEYEHLEKKMILFDNFKSKITNKAKISIPFKVSGIECEDFGVRLDGINIDLLKWSEPPEDLWGIEEIFSSIQLKE